jgi:hypothetical protein
MFRRVRGSRWLTPSTTPAVSCRLRMLFHDDGSSAVSFACALRVGVCIAFASRAVTTKVISHA